MPDKWDPWGYAANRSITGGTRGYRLDYEELDRRQLKVKPGMFMVFTRHDFVVPCGGSKEFPTPPDKRMLAGIYVQDSMDRSRVILTVQLHRIYTKFFKGLFDYYRFSEHVSLGPDGHLIPGAGHHVGRILKAPTEDDPYICISAQTFG